MDISKLPLWEDMPAVPNMPKGTAWGLFDKDGVRDEIGTLNLLSPEAVVRGREEIQTGKSISLNWGLEKIHEPTHGRAVLKHTFIDWREKPAFPFYSYDDEVTINTQSVNGMVFVSFDDVWNVVTYCKPKWILTGIGHWGHSVLGLYYNGLHHDDVIKSSHLGINHWNDRGGIVGRGVLLDYVAYAKRHGIEYTPMSDHHIKPAVLKEMAKESNITFLPGDILLVRTGWIKWYEEHSVDERREKITNGNAWVGVLGCEETLEFLWNNRFAAVAGDSIGWEVWPPVDDEYKLHNWLLSQWGMPIGEMWDLEKLAAECEKQQRWSFFLTSAPLNTQGGVASPPNALAVL